MSIIANITSPFGATLGHHEIARIEGKLTDAFLSLIVHSWPTMEDCASHGGNGATYVWPVSIPVENVLGGTGTLLQRCEDAVIAFDDPANPFQGGASAPSITDVASAKLVRWANIKQTRTMKDEAPIEYGDFSIDADRQSRQDIMGAIMAMQLSSQTSRLWRCSDNTMRELELVDLINIGTAIADRRQELIEISDGLNQELLGADTLEEVLAVVWPEIQ
jgi:hypothetical protein